MRRQRPRAYKGERGPMVYVAMIQSWRLLGVSLLRACVGYCEGRGGPPGGCGSAVASGQIRQKIFEMGRFPAVKRLFAEVTSGLERIADHSLHHVKNFLNGD